MGRVDRKCEEGGRSPVSPNNVATPSRGRPANSAADGKTGKGERGPTSSLEELMRRKGVDEAWNALEEMQHHGVQTDKYTVSRMLMKTVGDGRSRLNAARVYRCIALVERFIELQPKDVDEVLFNALLDTCCRLKDLPRLESTVNRMRELKVSPSPVTLGVLVKTYGQAGDLQKVLQVWDEMGKQRGQANAVTYGCMIDACVKCGHLEKAVEIFDGMRKTGKHKNTILYTTLIKGHGLEKDLQKALALFREMPEEGVPYNTITYNSVLDACIKCGDLATAEGLLREMTSPGAVLEPDLITFSTLLKGYCHIGDLDKALQVAEAIKARGLRCDELVYNTLMDGCVKANDVTAGIGLFEEMVQNGMKPSAITHSILARLYQRAGYEDAADAVTQLYLHHGLERPVGGDRGGRSGGNNRGHRGGHGARSPLGRQGGSYSATQSPISSPVNSESNWSGWGGMSAMPGYDFGFAECSAPSTPSMQGSPTNSNGLFIPPEALRGSSCVPPQLPGFAPEGSPFSAASCMSAPQAPSSCYASPANSAGFEPQPSFGMPASPHMATSHQPPQFGTCGTAGQLPPWPFQPCGSAYQGVPPPPPSGPPVTHGLNNLGHATAGEQQVVGMASTQMPGGPGVVASQMTGMAPQCGAFGAIGPSASNIHSDFAQQGNSQSGQHMGQSTQAYFDCWGTQMAPSSAQQNCFGPFMT